MNYSTDVIVLPSMGTMLLKTNRAVGLNLDGVPYKTALYKGINYLYLPWTLELCTQLAGLGINVRSDICYKYEWSGQFTPKAHQITTADFLTQNWRSFCFNDIGTGKTLSALWAADFLKNKGYIRKILVVCTVSTIKRVWEMELFNHFLHLKVSILHGTKAKRIKNLHKEADVYIINHDGLKVIGEAILERNDFDLIIVDEGAIFRNKQTELWGALHRIANVDTKRGVWWLTGSPTPNSPTDAWAQAKIVNPSIVPRYFNRFREKTMYRIGLYNWTPRSGWQDMVYSSLKPAIRFERDECLDLPPLQVIDHRVKMTIEQSDAYKELKDTFVIELAQGSVTAVNEMVKVNKLVQVSSGAIYTEQGDTYFFNVQHKLKELADIMVEVGDKLIVFVPYKHTVVLLKEWIEKQKNLWSSHYGVITGDVGMGRRSKIFHEFQNGNLKLIIAHPAAMAHGLTLTASNTIVWWSPVDNFMIYEQANGRITREGQNRKQYIKRLICSDIEQKIYERLERKESMQGILLDMMSNKPTPVKS